MWAAKKVPRKIFEKTYIQVDRYSRESIQLGREFIVGGWNIW